MSEGGNTVFRKENLRSNNNKAETNILKSHLLRVFSQII